MAESKTTRRDFIQGRSAVEMLGRLAFRMPNREVADAPTVDQDAARPYLLQLARRAMACEFEVCLPARQSPSSLRMGESTLLASKTWSKKRRKR